MAAGISVDSQVGLHACICVCEHVGITIAYESQKNLLPQHHTHLAVVLPHEGEEMHTSNMEHVNGPVILVW